MSITIERRLHGENMATHYRNHLYNAQMLTYLGIKMRAITAFYIEIDNHDYPGGTAAGGGKMCRY